MPMTSLDINDLTTTRDEARLVGEPVERPLTPALVIMKGRELGACYELTDRRLIVGRGDKADVLFAADSVSRQHAVLRLTVRSETFHLFVADLDSKNGTLVRGKRLQRAGELDDGDLLQIGDVLMRFVLLDAVGLAFHRKVAERVERARLDPLTGLLSRSSIEGLLPSVLSQHETIGRPLSLAMLDLDHFKGVNDRFGHLTGDEVLRRVSASIMHSMRQSDLAIRFGGEEFCLVWSGAPIVAAIGACERMRGRIEGQNWEELGAGLRVTASVGIAGAIEGEGLEQLMKRADNALYAAKRQGRNCVVRADPPVEITRPADAPTALYGGVPYDEDDT